MLLFAAVAGASFLTVYALAEAWQWAQNNWFNEESETEVAHSSYYSDAEWLQEPQAGIKYLVEDEDGVDTGETLDAVVEWINNDDPNILTGDWQAKVSTVADIGLIEICLREDQVMSKEV